MTTKTALISAGTTGLGAQIAKMLEAKGIQVLRTTSNKQKVNNKNILLWDMKGDSSTERLLEHLKDRKLQIDYFVHCAHVFSPSKLIMQVKDDEFINNLQYNLKELYKLSQHLSKKMSRAKSGRILFIGSYLSINPSPGKVMYIVEKNALTGLAQALHSEYYQKDVITNILHPALIHSDDIEDRVSSEVIKQVGKENLLKEEEVAAEALAILLESPRSCVQVLKGKQSWKHSI